MGCRFAAVAAALTLLAACTPRQDATAPPGAGSTLVPAVPKVLTVGRMREPVAIESFLGGISGAQEVRDFVHSYLVQQNYRDETIPQLAAELPAVDRGTWVVNADGTMDVTW